MYCICLLGHTTRNMELEETVTLKSPVAQESLQSNNFKTILNSPRFFLTPLLLLEINLSSDFCSHLITGPLKLIFVFVDSFCIT